MPSNPVGGIVSTEKLKEKARGSMEKNDQPAISGNDGQQKSLNIFGRLVYSNWFQSIITICIVLNSIQLGLDTSQWWTANMSQLSDLSDKVFIWIFAFEIILKLLSDKHRFFLSSWNIFDFIVVAISFVPGNGAFSILRAFRIFRTFRLLNKFQRLRLITESLITSIPSIGWICLLLSIWFYICSVIATNLFRSAFPDWFGTIPRSMYSLFQIMTLESWSMGIVRPVMREYPYAWMFFVPFIIFATYTVMNLFIGILVSAISEVQEEKRKSAVSAEKEKERQNSSSVDREILAELRAMRSEIQELKAENASLKAGLKDLKK